MGKLCIEELDIAFIHASALFSKNRWR